MKIGVLSGHRLDDLFKHTETIHVETPYGDVYTQVSSIGKHTLFFINRHGPQSNLPPHKIPYLATIQALSDSHVDCIISIATVGSLTKKIQPGDLVIPHDFIDMTKQRQYTFYDDQRVHVDMTHPYCPHLREVLIKTIQTNKSVPLHETGIYLATEGPRLETAAEINYYQQFAQIVGMTAVPEVILAREKGLCYASLCLVVNMAAGLQQKLTADEITTIYNKNQQHLSNILQQTISSLDTKKPCSYCTQDISKATL